MENGFTDSFSSKSLSSAIYQQQDWIREYGFRFRGITKQRGNQKVLLFFLDEPQILPGKGKRHEYPSDNSSARYIPYRYSEIENIQPEKRNTGIAAQIGMNYRLRKRRNRLIDEITEVDLQESGASRINPLIGELPSRREMENKLEELLMSM